MGNWISNGILNMKNIPKLMIFRFRKKNLRTKFQIAVRNIFIQALLVNDSMRRGASEKESRKRCVCTLDSF